MTFALLDDICLGLDAGAVVHERLPSVDALSLGPLVEWRHRATANGDDRQDWLNAADFGGLANALRARRKWRREGSFDQACIPAAALASDPIERTEFAWWTKKAAINAGFSGDIGGRFFAAIDEFAHNVVEHSEQADSGYVAFAAAPGKFEFVVGDHGIGVLNSLRTNPRFASLRDAGTALELALSEGVSRHREWGRGLGFRPLFVGLANISQVMRFRSGDHAREIIRNEDGNISSRTLQKSRLQGFVCSVYCKPPPGG